MLTPRRITLLLCLLLFGSIVCSAQKPELVLQTGHSQEIKSIAYSPDGKLLATGGNDETVKLWDTASSQEIRSLKPFGRVKQIAFSPDGKKIAAAGAKILIWDVNTGRELGAYDDIAFSLAFTPDGKFVVSGGYEGGIKYWDVASGREMRALATKYIFVNVVVSKDGKHLAALSEDNGSDPRRGSVQIWDFASGREIHTFSVSLKSYLAGLSFVSDGKTLVGPGNNEGEIKVWDVVTGQEVKTLGVGGFIAGLNFSPAGDTMVSLDAGSECRLLDISSGRELRKFETRIGGPSVVASFSPDGRMLARAVIGNEIDVLNVQTGQTVATFKKHSNPLFSLAFRPDGRGLAVGGVEDARLWDFDAGGSAATLRAEAWCSYVAFSPDGKLVATGGYSSSTSSSIEMKVWNASTRELLGVIKYGEREHGSSELKFMAFSPDSKFLVAGRNWNYYENSKQLSGSDLSIWDVTSREKLRAIEFPAETISVFAYSLKGNLIASSNEPKIGDMTNSVKPKAPGGEVKVQLWESKTGRLVRSIEVGNERVHTLSLSHDGNLLAVGMNGGLRVWDSAKGVELSRLEDLEIPTPMTFSPDGKLFAALDSYGRLTIWDVASGKVVRHLAAYGLTFNSIAFSPDGKLLATAGDDAKVHLWEVKTGRELADLIALDQRDWAVVTGDGHYDASPKAMELMHWIVGLETISLNQLKERYYEPNLLPKLLGYSKEPVRDVSAFTDVKLSPSVTFDPPAPGSTKLDLKLTDRGGGIGRVQVFVNNKEVTPDARGGTAKSGQTTLSVDLASAPYVTGRPNEIRVVAWNEEGYISGPGEVRTWTPAGAADSATPQLYAIVAGVSNYSSQEIGLRYPDKDASDFAKALGMGAKKLFGAERAHITLFNTSGQAGTTAPTKANLKKAFEEIARTATPSDLFVVYMAGHGTGKNGTDSYFFLTQDARGFSDLEDPAVRAQVTVSSDELTEWVKAIPALKQIMVLDTCAAGQAASALVERRSVSADQIRAIERLKDRTGFHVLMGSAADAVSYEASQYGQGLLTYALLQGMRGAALRDGEYVDVSPLFQYAADQVPRLAKNIGGVQQPRVAAPRGTSFDIGRLEAADKEQIPLAQMKPLILRPVLINPDEGTDNLGLMPALRKALNEESFVESRGLLGGGGRGPSMLYVDADEMPGAVRPSGTYTVTGGKVSVKMFLTRDGQKVGPLLVEGMANDQVGLVKRLWASIKAAVGQMKN